MTTKKWPDHAAHIDRSTGEEDRLRPAGLRWTPQTGGQTVIPWGDVMGTNGYNAGAIQQTYRKLTKADRAAILDSKVQSRLARLELVDAPS